jgi:anti-anti-sigma factor
MDAEIPLLTPFSLRTERPADGVVLVAIEGELDIQHSAEVRAALRDAVLSPGGEAVIADLTKLEFIDSMGLVALTDAARILERNDRAPLVVVGGGLQVRRVLELTGIDRIVDMVESADPALA